jgi:DNA polymerase-3 subunit alpha
MKLTDFYKKLGVPKKDQIIAEKNIMLVVPSEGYDIQPVLDRMGISRYEVAVTYPKDNVNLLAEVCAAKPLVVAQVDHRFSKKWPLIGADGDWDSSFEQSLKDAVTDRFVALHHHDEFSIKDGLGTVEQLIKILKAQRRSYCCVTNHGNVGGWIRQYNACREAGIKPIFGMEAYMKRDRAKERSANHLILLANNMDGFYNIIKIHNDAQVNGRYYDPRANWECIEKWGKGIVGTSACFAGEIPRFLMDDKLSEEDRFVKSKEVYDFYKGSFDKFFVELQIIEFEEQRELNRRLIDFCHKVDGKFVLACDSHYLEAEQADTHDLLMMARQGKTKLDQFEDKEDVWNFEVRNLYYRNAEQMTDTFQTGFDEQELVKNEEEGIMERETVRRPPLLDDVFTEEIFNKAMANTHNIALECEDIILDDSVKLPKLYDDSAEMLRVKANDGFKWRGLHKMNNKQEYIDRMIHEFEIINKLGWPDYFLVMEYIVKWTIDNYGEWSVGYGRGSAAGSLVAYCLNVTDIDPIPHGLLFERFLDESRPDPPDIDTDFDPRIRQKVKDHIVERFGEDYTCSIGTYQTYKTKAAIVEMARVLGLDVHEAQIVTKKMDSLQSFEDDDGEEETVDKMSFDELEKHYPELKEYFEQYPEVKIHAKVLRNQVKNMGKHAGGIIISDLNLKGRIPVQLDANGSIVSSWAESGNAAELSKVGLVKYDILGLNNLPVIGDCVELVKQTKGIEIKRSDIPINDRESIRMGAKRDLVGIFQFENPATREIVDLVQMENLNDVSAITSLLRPGPKDMGMHEEYGYRKHGAEYDLPDFLRPILGQTYGILTYQEQMMQISKALSGFDGPMANKLRKACGKKLIDLMESIKSQFIDGAKARIDAGEITEIEVEEMWELIASFASYSFNKSHAVAYSAITTAQLWLKYHYPVEFITALVNNTKQGKKKW